MKKGFTLAEMLVAMSVIGIISAVTIPAINNNLWASQRGPMLKTAYEKLANGLAGAISQLGYVPTCYEKTATTKAGCQNLGNKIVESDTVLRITRTCKGDDCNFKYKSDEGFENINSSKAYFMNEGFILINTDSSLDYFSPHRFAVDINGAKGPNKWGQDVFILKTKAYIDGNGELIQLTLIPDGEHGVEDHLPTYGATAEDILRNRD